MQPFKVPQLSGSLGGEPFGQVPRSACALEAELMVKGVEGTEEGTDEEEELEGRCVLVG